MELAHRARLDGDLCDSNRGRDREGGRVDDFDRAAIELRCVYLREREHEWVRDLALRVIGCLRVARWRGYACANRGVLASIR